MNFNRTKQQQNYHNSVALVIYNDGEERLVLILSGDYIIRKKIGKYLFGLIFLSCIFSSL